MIPSGTTITNAKIASFSERPSALVRIGPIGAWYWYDVPGKLRDPVPVLGQDRLVDAELVVERVDRARRRQRPEDRAPGIAREDLAEDEHDHAQEPQRDQREAETLEDEPDHVRSGP